METGILNDPPSNSTILNNNESTSNKLKFAIKGVNLNKTYIRRSYLISKTKSIILDNLNINVIRGHMLVNILNSCFINYPRLFNNINI
jgi:hypothetical protein